MTIPFLETPRLLLRPLSVADIDGPYLEWFNDPEVCRFNGHHVVPYLRDDAVRYVEGLTQTRNLVLAMVRREDGRHIGNIALQDVDPVHRAAEFAIVIGDKTTWGQGYSVEAGRMLLAHGFNSMNLHRICCGTSSDNVPMQRLALALGMRQEGVRREAMFKRGRYVDLVEFGVLRVEFTRAQ